MTREEIRAYQRSLIRHFVESQDYIDKDVLDYGCGTGPYKAVVETKGGHYVGYNGGKHPGGSTENVGEPGLLFDRHWDVILCTQVLQYVESPNGLLFNFRNALKPRKGTLVLSYATNWPETDPDDLCRYTFTGMERLLADWTIVEHSKLGDARFSTDETVAFGYGIVAKA